MRETIKKDLDSRY